MMHFLENMPVFWLSVVASLFCWLCTALGAAAVFLFKRDNHALLDILTGFASGVMLAALFWSLLSPAIELSTELGYVEWLFPVLGVLTGGGFVVGVSVLLDKTTLRKRKLNASKKRSALLVLSVTLHNIPEGMCVGVAFGALAMGTDAATAGALTLAFGIGLQNMPEGAGVALPLLRDGMGRKKAFAIGQLSGIVEPVFALAGYFLCAVSRAMLPFLLSFSAGAMIAVVASELIPDACKNHKNGAALGCLVGFAVMMLLDVALG